ncbi:AAA ATPase domain containing protein [Nitzschia inconspicua]|uniref:AAA ATPase domain containing protein n=1 Tax=Nitzschia inconspicua TaxID=303405 RepID=A0A9K3LBX8_9STRA|nr:AAA ATPase domain containing protein [Nitzschia inconspicua]
MLEDSPLPVQLIKCDDDDDNDTTTAAAASTSFCKDLSANAETTTAAATTMTSATTENESTCSVTVPTILPRRRLDFGAIAEDSDVRRSELGLLLNYAIVPDDNDYSSDDTTSSSSPPGTVMDRNNHNINNNNHHNIHNASSTVSGSGGGGLMTMTRMMNNNSTNHLEDDDVHYNDASSTVDHSNGCYTYSTSNRRKKQTSIPNNNNTKPLSIITTIPTIHKHSRPAVWIEAEAGVGKSCLLQQFRTEVQSLHPHRVVLMQGKFEPRAAASEPFAALREAVKDFVQSFLLLSSSSSSSLPQHETFRQEWATGLKEKMDSYGAFHLLLGILPELRPCFDTEQDPNQKSMTKEAEEAEKDREDDTNDKDDSNPFGNFNSREYRFERFRVAFRNMIRFTCNKLWCSDRKRALVLILDDFHWVDPDSMQIVKTLMEDPKKPHNFRIIAATRPLDDYPNVLNLYTILTVPTEAVSDSHSTLKYMAASRRNLATNESFAGKVSFNTKIRYSKAEKSRHNEESSISEPSEATMYRRIPNLEMMELSKLSTKQIADLLYSLLVMKQQADEEDDTEEEYLQGLLDLARIVKDKTKGNTFVAIQFLRLVERQELFEFDEMHHRWNFNVNLISKLDYQSENVSEVVTKTLESGSKRRNSALMIAASFGVSQFDVTTIVHASAVLQEEDDINDSMDNEDCNDPMVVKMRINHMKVQLAEALEDGLVDKTPSGNFRFAHDRIRESAYSLLPEGLSRKEVHLKVGRQLRAWMDTQEELGLFQSGFSKESLLLHATKQLNAAADLIVDDWERIDLADLNYQAAELAARKTSFVSAVEYLQNGLQHLGGDAGWSEQYDRTLKFHVALARMQYSCGLLEDCWTTSDAVVRNGRNFKDTELIHRTRVLCLLQNDMLDNALDLVLDVLEMMGEAAPRKFVMIHGIRGVIRARAFLNVTSDEKLLGLPIIRDDHLETQLDFLQYLIEIAFLLGRSDYLFYCAMRLITLISEEGNYRTSFLATQFWACYFKTHMGDFSEAMRYGVLSNKLAERQKLEYPGFVARSDEMYYGHVYHWVHPYRESLQANIDAFQRLWDSGFVDTALVDAATLLHHLFVAGEPLQKIANVCSDYSEAFVDYQQLTHWYTNAPQHQAVLNLLGRSPTPAVLSGEVLDSQARHKISQKTLTPTAHYYFQIWSLVVAFHFRDLQKAKQHVKAMQGDPMADIPNLISPLRPFYSGLTYFQLFRLSGQYKHCRRALVALKTLHSWVKRGAVNCVYMCRLLEAEHQASMQNISAAMKTFDEAIASATELQLVHHIALSYELAGLCLVHHGQGNKAKGYLDQSLSHYEKWGARAIVDDLKLRFEGMLISSTGV